MDWINNKLRGRYLHLAIGMLVFLVIVIFMHFRSIKCELLDPIVVDPYLIAQVDFEFPIGSGILSLGDDGSADLVSVYHLSKDEVDHACAWFEEAIVSNLELSKKIEVFSRSSPQTVANKIKLILYNARFAYDRDVDAINLFDPSAGVMLVTLPQHFKSGGSELPKVFWETVREEVLPLIRDDQLASEVISKISGIKWHLDLDRDLCDRYKDVPGGLRPVRFKKAWDKYEVGYTNGNVRKAVAMAANVYSPSAIAASLIICGIITVVWAIYFISNYLKYFENIYKFSMYCTIVVATIILSKIIEFLILNNYGSYFGQFQDPLIVPVAAVLLCMFFGGRIALFTSFIMSVLIGAVLAVDHSRFILVNSVISMAIIGASGGIRRRRDLFFTFGRAWVWLVPLVIACSIARGVLFLPSVIVNLTISACWSVLSALLIVILIPMFERVFKTMTGIALIEYLNPDSELMRNFVAKAPGTYHHSLIVGSVAEAVAESIGAHGLFCRVAALYHDIGKLSNPYYYIENQTQSGGFNVHLLLTATESTKVIIDHVSEGEKLAKKYGLPDPFRAVIREHHGDMIVQCFYQKFVEQNGGAVVDDKMFRYPGPKPQTKESAIIMMVDSVEAASRAVQAPSREDLRAICEKLMDERYQDGQFDQCQLSFEEFKIAKNKIVDTLFNFYHRRTPYPPFGAK